MSRLAVLALVALAPVARAAQGWTPLEAPGLTRERAPRRDLPALVDGAHLRVPRAALRDEGPGASTLPPATLRRLLEEEIRTRELDAEVHPAVGLLAVRGSADAVAALAARVDELDRADRARAVRITATHVAPDGARRTDALTLTSGETGVLGERRQEAFVFGYDVEVAHDSGVADPIVGRVATGRTLHLTAWRAGGGRGAVVAGFLDVAELLESRPFDPGTPELGVIDRPAVRSVQVAFSGWVENGGELAVDLAGTGVAGADGRLAVSVETAPDPAPTAGWRVLDLALIESRSAALPFPLAGSGADLELPAERPPAAAPPLGAIDVLRAATQAATASEWPRLESAPGLVVGPTDDPAWREVEDLAAAAEHARLRTATLAVEAGDLRARFPVAVGLDARLLATTEETWVVDYDVSLAPETWMAAPVVEVARDGLVVQGRLAGDALEARGWRAQTAGARQLGRDDSTLGAMHLLDRAYRTGRWTASGTVELFPVEAESPRVTLTVQ